MRYDTLVVSKSFLDEHNGKGFVVWAQCDGGKIGYLRTDRDPFESCWGPIEYAAVFCSDYEAKIECKKWNGSGIKILSATRMFGFEDMFARAHYERYRWQDSKTADMLEQGARMTELVTNIRKMISEMFASGYTSMGREVCEQIADMIDIEKGDKKWTSDPV